MTKSKLNQLWTDSGHKDSPALRTALRQFLAATFPDDEDGQRKISNYLGLRLKHGGVKTATLSHAVYRAVRDHKAGTLPAVKRSWTKPKPWKPIREPIPDTYPAFAIGGRFISVSEMPSRIQRLVRPLLAGTSLETLAKTNCTTIPAVMEILTSYRTAVKARLDRENSPQ